MLNRKYLPSLGFVILMITLISSIFFMKWALGPLKYDRAFEYEVSAHTAFEKKDFDKAYELFISSADISDDNLSKSKRYRYAAISLLAVNKESEALKYFKKAMILNPNSETLKREYKKWRDRR